MKKVVIIVLIVLALLSATLAKSASKMKYFESKCSTRKDSLQKFREACAKPKPKPKPRTRPTTPKPKTVCWKVNHKGKRIGGPKRCPRRTCKRRFKQIYITKMKKHRKSMKMVWFYLAKLEKRLSSQKLSLEKRTKRKHEKYLGLVKNVDTLKKQVDSAQVEYEKLKKVVDGKEQGYEKVIDQLKSFEKQYEAIRTKYLQHVRNAEALYAKYQKSLSSKTYVSLKAELEVLAVCKSKMSWLKRLLQKYVKTKTIYKKQYIFLYKNRKVLIGGKCVCPVVLRPVCGKDGVTYSSRCVARCAGAKVSYHGACKCKPNNPSTSKPKTTKPKTTKPSTTKPSTTKPTTRKPKTRKPKTRKPKTRKPKTRKPVETFTEVDCSKKEVGTTFEESCN